MALKPWAAPALLGVVVAAVIGATATVDLAHVSGGQFWSDGATYHGMAWSLAEDLDVRYEARDVFRTRREFAAGPQGIFLKRSSGGLAFAPDGGFPWFRRIGPDEPRVYYAKSFAYPLFASPLVRAFGTRGLLLTNGLALALALVLGYRELRHRGSGPWPALALVVALFLATVTPLYLVWPTPELFNLGVIAAALVAWSRGWPLLSAALFALAAFSKPYNVLLALPLGVQPLLAPWGKSLLGGLRESLRRGAVLIGGTLLLFGVNKAITGEMNYQGGERKTFYGRFPFETADVTFGNSGIWMTTDHLGPLVEGEDEERLSRRTGPLRAPGEIRDSFFRNLGYFWVGRFGGALPYYATAVAALLLFLLVGPRDARGRLAVAALAASYLFYIGMIPDNWYGGGGTVGNRYFLNLLPLFLFMVPPGRELPAAAAGVVGWAVFLAPIHMDPLGHSLRPVDHATRGAFRVLPAELTMLNDLSAFTEPWRKKQPYGDTEGDAHKNWPADPEAYWLYFPDDGTHGREAVAGEEGFWIRGGEPAEVILRTLEPARRVTVLVTGGPLGDEVSIELGVRRERVAVGTGETRSVAFEPGPGFTYYDSFLHVMDLRSARGGRARGEDRRVLGAFVRIRLEVDKRPRP